MKITDYDLTAEQVEKIDRELQETVGIELEHEPYLSDRFKDLFIEDPETIA